MLESKDFINALAEKGKSAISASLNKKQMNIIPINKDVKRVKTLLESGNKKALDNMFETFTLEYRLNIRSNLDPFTEKLFDDWFL